MTNKYEPEYGLNVMYVTKGFFSWFHLEDNRRKFTQAVHLYGDGELGAMDRVAGWADKLEDAGCAMANIIGEYPGVWAYEVSEAAGDAFFELVMDKGFHADPMPVIRKVLLGFFFQFYHGSNALEVAQCWENTAEDYTVRCRDEAPPEGVETFWSLYAQAEDTDLWGCLADGTEEDIKGLLCVLLGSPVAMDGKDVYKTLS